ncbi:MAG: hypothetical protein ACKOTZ_13140, partial [Chloroflexota bacterium]
MQPIDSEALVSYARAVVRSVPGILAAYVGYEPDADGHDGDAARSPALAGACNAAGRFLPYVVRRNAADASDLTVEPLRDMETSLYFRAVKNRFALRPETEGVTIAGRVSAHWSVPVSSEASRTATMVTEPYEYHGLHIVEQTHAIVIGGHFMGIVGVDRSLSSIATMLDAFLPDDASAWLISARGRVVASTSDRGRAMLPSERRQPAALLAAAYGRSADELAAAGARVVADPATGERRVVAAARLASAGWTL